MNTKIKNLNETLIGNCNMEVLEGNVETKGTVPEVYADAINQRRERTKKIEQDFKEQVKLMNDFEKESQKTTNEAREVDNMKKIHLDESLFEDFDTSKLYKTAERIADDIEQFLKDISKIENVDDYFNEYDLKDIDKVKDILTDFAQAYSYVMDNETVFEAVETEPQKKKRCRAPSEKEYQYGIDYSDTDLWTQIYDELDASLENEGEGKQVNRFLKPKKGDRYEYIVPAGENDIVVGAKELKDFDYAKKVADYYGVTYDTPVMDKNPRTNTYYKYTMRIRIPKDKDPVVKH